jgi:hypothetical protein
MTFTKVLDVSDLIEGIARVSLEKSDGERLSAVLSEAQIVYWHSRLSSIVLKIKAKEEPVS